MKTKTFVILSVGIVSAVSYIAGVATGLYVSNNACKKCVNREKEVVVFSDINTENVEPDQDDDSNNEVREPIDFNKLKESYKKAESYNDILGVIKEFDDPMETNDRQAINSYIYIITQDEFLNNDDGSHMQSTLVWFEDDAVMADSQDEILPIQEWSETLGVKDIESYFGVLSVDDDVVYFRNDKLMYDYEVIREHSSYSKSVLGADPVDLTEEDYKAALEFFNIDEEKKE